MLSCGPTAGLQMWGEASLPICVCVPVPSSPVCPLCTSPSTAQPSFCTSDSSVKLQSHSAIKNGEINPHNTPGLSGTLVVFLLTMGLFFQLAQTSPAHPSAVILAGKSRCGSSWWEPSAPNLEEHRGLGKANLCREVFLLNGRKKWHFFFVHFPTKMLFFQKTHPKGPVEQVLGFIPNPGDSPPVLPCAFLVAAIRARA